MVQGTGLRNRAGAGYGPEGLRSERASYPLTGKSEIMQGEDTRFRRPSQDGVDRRKAADYLAQFLAHIKIKSQIYH